MKKRNNNVFLAVSFILLLFGNCENAIQKKPIKANKEKYYKNGRFLVRETYDSSGRLQAKQFFNKDTIPDGAEIDYYMNGNVEKWKWYTLQDKYPRCLIHYDDNGIYDTIKGNPFIDGIKANDTDLAVKFVNPLNVKSFIMLEDKYKNEIVVQYKFDPISLDTVNIVILNKKSGYAKKVGHQYLIYFYIIDSVRSLLHRTPKAIELKDDYFNTINIPSKVFPLDELKEE